ncbi:putative chromophore lyase CpcT/CpeT [Helianthus annuus]|nr:putative chromophore lyase CpcT/CpeT [Helianthus annuus]
MNLYMNLFRWLCCPAADMVDGSKVLYFEQAFWRTPHKPFRQNLVWMCYISLPFGMLIKEVNLVWMGWIVWILNTEVIVSLFNSLFYHEVIRAQK